MRNLLKAEDCEVCKARPGQLFAVVRDATRTARAHLCLPCFEVMRGGPLAEVEEISYREWKEIRETV